MDNLIKKYLINEADFIDLTQANKNVDNAINLISILEDWLNMSRSLIINGKRNDAIRVVKALKRKIEIFDTLVKKIPNRKITNTRLRRNKII